MSGNQLESQRDARKRLAITVLPFVAVAAIFGAVALVSAAQDECGTPELSRLDPPRPEIPLAAPLPPAPPPPPGASPEEEARRADGAGDFRGAGGQESEREAIGGPPPACVERNPRHKILAADARYEAGEFAEAVRLYEEALEEEPELAIGHHNAGLAYRELFEAESDDDGARSYALAAAEHLEAYVESYPHDDDIRTLLTRTWANAERYERAIRHWEERLEGAPEDPYILQLLARLHRRAENYDQAIAYHEERAEIAEDAAGETEALVDIAKLQLSRLRGADLAGRARREVADRGVAALQSAARLDVDERERERERERILRYLGSLYQLRLHAHGASWGRAIDRATAHIHIDEWLEATD